MMPQASGNALPVVLSGMVLDDCDARENALLREKSDLLQRQATMAQEFEHRLLNSLQSIVSLLSLQSRTVTTTEGAAQL
jgi:two-component sensor histidine kinase